MQLEKIKMVFHAELSYGSTQQYIWHLKQYLTFLEEKGISPNSADASRSIQNYVYSQTIEADTPWTKSMANVAFYALKRYYEKIEGVPVEKRFFTNTGAESKHKPRILERKEVQRVWREAHRTLGEVEQVMLHVGWETALRSGELTSLKGENLTQERELDVRILKAKNARKRVGLSPETYERAVRLGRAEERYLFLHKVNSPYSDRRHYTSLEWSCLFHRWTDQFLGDGGIRWHDFARHTRLTHYAEDTKSFLAVLQLSGHQNPKVCRQYFERAKIDVPELKVIGKQDWNW